MFKSMFRKSNPNLIYDIGVNEGEDSSFYLEKGFRVVGAEANPILAERLKDRFAKEIKDGLYTLVENGIWSERGAITFYKNNDNSHWSSFDRKQGTRNGTSYEELSVRCITIKDLLSQFGPPYYMKIDVEGADKIIINQLKRRWARPEFISIEEYGVSSIDEIHRLGYKSFQIAPQRTKDSSEPPNPPREGSYVHRSFNGYDSGPFGLELPGQWLSYDAARTAFIAGVRNEAGKYVGPEYEWHDIHGSLRERH